MNITLTASFDSLAANSAVAKTYSENGLTFGTQTNFNVVSGQQAGTLFGGGHWYTGGNALVTYSNDWVSISASDYLSSVAFKYGLDWSFYAIESGLLTTSLDWQAWSGGQLLTAGTFGPSTGHGGQTVTIAPGASFDTLLVASHAQLYSSATWNFTTQKWDRGAPLATFAGQNHIAFDDVSLTFAAVPAAPAARFAQATPEGEWTVMLLAFVICTLALVRQARKELAI